MGNISSMSREQLKFKFNAKAHREFRFADTVVGLYDFPVHNDQRATVVVMSHITGRDMPLKARFYQLDVADAMLVELQIKCAGAVLLGQPIFDAPMFRTMAARYQEQDKP